MNERTPQPEDPPADDTATGDSVAADAATGESVADDAATGDSVAADAAGGDSSEPCDTAPPAEAAAEPAQSAPQLGPAAELDPAAGDIDELSEASEAASPFEPSTVPAQTAGQAAPAAEPGALAGDIDEPFDQRQDPEPPAGADPQVPSDAGWTAAGPGSYRQDPPPPGPPPGPQPGQTSGWQQPSVRRLYRSRRDRRVAGVAGGVAEYLGIDSTIVRLATLVLALTGIGILLYLAAWLIIPEAPAGYVEPDRPRTTLPTDRTLSMGLGIAALAVAFGIVTGSWAILAFALVAGGVWLLSEQSAVPVAAPARPDGGAGYYQPPRSEPYPSQAWGTEAPTATSQPVPPYVAYDPPLPKEPRRPQRVTWTVLALLALLAAIGLASSAAGWWDIGAIWFLGVGLIVIAVGVVVGQIMGGGARGLVPLLVLTALAMFPVSAVDGLLDEGVGEARYEPTDVVQLQESYEHGIGQLTVDLSAIDFEGLTETIDIDLGMGELIVIVPEDLGGTADLTADAGEVRYRDNQTGRQISEDGLHADSGTIILPGEQGAAVLDIDVGFGSIELRTAARDE